MSGQQGEDTDDQIKSAPSGISATCEYDKVVLRGHWIEIPRSHTGADLSGRQAFD
jgi:hypothetical protein